MKKKITTLLAFVMLAVTTTFAASGDDTVSKDAATTFADTFEKATDVKWEKEDTYYKASFTMNDQAQTAYITEDGDLIAVSRNIVSTQLPAGLKASLNKNYAAYWISNLIEYTVQGENQYFVTIENAEQTTILQNSGTHEWSVLKKTSK